MSKGMKMRLKLLGLSLLSSVLAPVLLSAALCEDTFHLQSIVQTDWKGTDPKALQRMGSKTVPANLSDLQPLDTLMAYTIMTKFEGACAKASKPDALKTKPRNAGAFKDSVDNDYLVQLFDTNTIVDSQKYDYWFGFFKPANTLRFYLPRMDSRGPAFVGWYVGIIYSDSTRSESGIWPPSKTRFYDLTGPDDSASLERRVLDETIGKLPASGGNYGVSYRVQFLKVSYENKPAPNRIVPPRRNPPSGFSARQTGNLVLIQTGMKSASEPVGLYNMLGNKIATHHPTGSQYQWNGRTAAGADAPTGVYFLQGGNRVLGKFFYAR